MDSLDAPAVPRHAAGQLHEVDLRRHLDINPQRNSEAMRRARWGEHNALNASTTLIPFADYRWIPSRPKSLQVSILHPHGYQRLNRAKLPHRGPRLPTQRRSYHLPARRPDRVLPQTLHHLR